LLAGITRQSTRYRQWLRAGGRSRRVSARQNAFADSGPRFIVIHVYIYSSETFADDLQLPIRDSESYQVRFDAVSDFLGENNSRIQRHSVDSETLKRRS